MKKTVAPFLVLTLLIIGGCATLKYPPPPAPAVHSLPPTTTGPLSEVSNRFSANHKPGQSGFLDLSDNQDAFEWRLALVDQATQSIDVQYFIWQSDATGVLLFDRLLKAADRGVRVRMLVDNFAFAAKNRSIAAITKHPNFDMKIFNPGKVRESTLGGIGEFILYFKELNRRMHNKLLVVDNQLAIVGGRNIGNPYFGLDQKYNFRDLDVLVIGPVVEEISNAFDQYWNAELAYPGSAMSDKATIDDNKEIRQRIADFLAQKRDLLASYQLHPSLLKKKVLQLPFGMQIGEAHFLQDKPVAFGDEQYRLVDMLDYIAQPSQSEIIFVSPYLIPVEGFLEDVAKVVKKGEGVDIKFLTGSLGANNHTAAHSHYKKYRKRILKTGAELFEFKHHPSQAVREVSDVPPVQAKFISLHIKAIVVDKQRCFVGSLNLDPRAVEINTENGLYIESPGFCGLLAAKFETLMSPDNAWYVYLNEDNQLRWASRAGTVSIQPARSFMQRISDFFFRLMPIEKQL